MIGYHPRNGQGAAMTDHLPMKDAGLSSSDLASVTGGVNSRTTGAATADPLAATLAALAHPTLQGAVDNPAGPAILAGITDQHMIRQQNQSADDGISLVQTAQSLDSQESLTALAAAQAARLQQVTGTQGANVDAYRELAAQAATADRQAR
jgi:hypothetical protein